MAFDGGRVSFSRCRVVGDAPLAVDESLLERLSEGAFVDSDLGAPEEVTRGFCAGAHLFDVSFTYEKNAFGDQVLLALRIDTNKPPADVRRAYRLVQEQALAATNPSGFISRAQKREATELADRQLHDEIAQGRHRRSKLIPLLWDLRNRQLLVGASGGAVLEEVANHFREALKLEVEPLTPGNAAGELLRGMGKTRDYEDLLPTPFTKPPAAARRDADDLDDDAPRRHDLSIPFVPWAFRQSTDAKDFLGNEMLLWLWWITESAEGLLKLETPAGKAELAIVLDKALDMDCAWAATGKQTLRGERGVGVTRLPEAGEALRQGKWPRRAGVILSDGQHQWEFTLQADQGVVSACMLPEIEESETARQFIEQRLDMTRQLTVLLDSVMAAFVKLRVSNRWAATRDQISQWIATRRRPTGAMVAEPVTIPSTTPAQN
ncbi:MAG: hypothetical protein IT442_14530 [Phycisphaeraceae bacterium]|nr:hypothetical protein [Phycisphaeraceae bacterium]